MTSTSALCYICCRVQTVIGFCSVSRDRLLPQLLCRCSKVYQVSNVWPCNMGFCGAGISGIAWPPYTRCSRIAWFGLSGIASPQKPVKLVFLERAPLQIRLSSLQTRFPQKGRFDNFLPWPVPKSSVSLTQTVFPPKCLCMALKTQTKPSPIICKTLVRLPCSHTLRRKDVYWLWASQEMQDAGPFWWPEKLVQNLDAASCVPGNAKIYSLT